MAKERVTRMTGGNILKQLVGFSVPLNPFTALITGVLGLPGLALVIALDRLL